MDPRKLCHISDLPNNLQFLPIEIKHLLPVHHPKFVDNLHTIVAHQAELQQWMVFPDLTLTLANPHYSVLSGGWCQDIDGKQQHLKSSLELSSIILNYISSLLQSPVMDQQFSSPQMVYRADHIGFETSPNEFHFPLVLAYNIYKTRDKQSKTRFIFMVGYHRSSQLRLFSLLNGVRNFNINRFKSDMCRDISINRISKTIQHLLIILRGFLPLEEDDHLGKQKQLQLLISELEGQSLPLQIPRKGIQQNHQVILSRFEWAYKGKIQQRDITIFISEVLTELLKIIPINTACSFAGKNCHEPKLNQFVLLWMTAFKRTKNHSIPDTAALETVARQATSFIRKKTVENIKDSTTNIADQMLRSSLKVLSRYAPGDQRTNAKDWGAQSQASRARQNSFRSFKSSVVQEKPRNPDFDRMSVISRISFKDNQSGREGRAKMSAQFESLSSPLMAHRDKQYGQLLSIIVNWQTLHGAIPTWPQLNTKLLLNCQTAGKRYAYNNLTQLQSQLLLSLSSLRYYLDTDQFFLLLKYHSEHRQALFQVIFQGSAAQFLLDLGLKIAKQYSRLLYETYITKDFHIDSNNLLTVFMKRFVSLFASELQVRDFGDKINVPLLLDLIERKEFTGQNYKQLAKSVLSEIFVPNKPIMLLSPILQQIYLSLAEDHHEELVNSLIGDLAFETVYFQHDIGIINHSPYIKTGSGDLRQKKLLELLREGGFNSLGYQLRTTLKPLIFKFANYSIPSARIYEEIIISRPLQVGRFVELISKSTFLQHLIDINSFFKDIQNVADCITRPLANAYLQKEVIDFDWNRQSEDVTEGVHRSESGIFKQLLQYNPQIKLAGRPLSEVLRQHQSRKPVTPQRFDSQYVLSTIFKQNLQQVYEFILIVSNLKQKYDSYDSLKQDQRIYLREIVHQVLCRKNDILEYLQLSLLAKQFTDMQVPFLF